MFKWMLSSRSNSLIAYLDEQRPPGDEEQDDRQDVGEEGGGDVEEVGGGAVRRRGLAGGVHADLREKRENKMQNCRSYGTGKVYGMDASARHTSMKQENFMAPFSGISDVPIQCIPIFGAQFCK